MLKNFFAIVAIARVLRGGHPVRQARPRRLPKKRGSGPKRGMSSSVFGPTMTFRMGGDDDNRQSAMAQMLQADWRSYWATVHAKVNGFFSDEGGLPAAIPFYLLRADVPR